MESDERTYVATWSDPMKGFGVLEARLHKGSEMDESFPTGYCT